MERDTRKLYGGTRHLTGQADDYVDPVRAVLFELHLLLSEYHAKGGDLNDVRLTCSLESAPGRMARPHLRVDLRGYGWPAGTTAADANNGSTPTETS